MLIIFIYLYFRKEVNVVREGIHPDYKQTVIKCACGNVIETGSTKENIFVMNHERAASQDIRPIEIAIL